MKPTELSSLEDIKKNSTNMYEAVLIASKRARQLNEERIQKLEMMPQDDSIDVDPRKVTEIALRDLADGKLRVDRK
jgi:DNA-directed RNA polymerase omega subunit